MMTTTSHHPPMLALGVGVGAGLADQAAAFAEFTRLMSAAADGDPAALVALETDEDPFDEIDRRAREYGLTACGGAD